MHLPAWGASCQIANLLYSIDAMKEPFEIQASLLTDIGRVRSRNQDTLGHCVPVDPALLADSGRLYIVADGAGGVGGAVAGKVASRFSVWKVKDIYFRAAGSQAPIGERLRAAMLAANDAIREHVTRPRRTRQMATTMVAAVVRGAELTLANVGDSRAYLLRDGAIQQLTRDHSLVAGLVADGIITAEEAANHPQRNVILYSLGSAPQEPRIDIFPLALRPKDVILLCTDGLTRYADEKQLLALLSEKPAEKAAQRLIDFANESGGADNVSVALLSVRKRKTPRWVWWLLLLIGVGLIVLSGLAGLWLMGWKLLGA
jgi:serine/threonine protein phosphatase PrpC